MERWTFRTKVLILCVIIIASLGTFGGYMYYAPQTEKVRIGYLRGDLHHLAYFVAAKKGWYARDGLTIESSLYENGVKEMDAFASNSIDIGYLGIAPALLKKINANVNVTIVSAVNVDGSAIMVAKGSDIDSLSDLKGKTIGIPGYGTVQNILLLVALDQAGISKEDVNMIKTAPWNMETSLDKGQIDGFVAWEPYNAKAAVNNVSEYLKKSSEIWPNHPCCVIAVRSQYLQEHRDKVEKIVKIHIEATNWIYENPEEVITIAAEATGVEAKAIRLAMENVKFIYKPEKKGIKTYLQKLIQHGYIDASLVPDIDAFLDSYIDDSIIESVA